MHERAVLPQIQIPGVRLFRQLLGADTREQLVVIVLALAAADDLAIALRREAVVVEHGPRIGRVLLHIESLHALRVVVDEHRPVVLLRERGLVLSAQVAAARHVGAEALEPLDGVGVRDAVERRLHALERCEIAPQLGEIRLPPLQAAAHDVRNEILLQPHVGVRIIPRTFGLDHPELRQVPARLRFLGAERRAETIALAERRGGGLHVQLAGLRERGLPEIEIVQGEQGARVLADRAGEDRRIDEREVPFIKEVANRLHDLVAHSRDRNLLLGAQPQMAVLEQVCDPVLLRRDRELGTRSEDLQVRRLQLDAAPPRCARVRPHAARQLQRSLLSKFPERVPDLGRHIFFGDDRLQIARAVAHHDERDLPARASRRDPAAHRDRLAGVPRKLFDPMAFGHRRGILVASLFSVNAIATACAPTLKTGPVRQESGWSAYLGNQRHDAGARETLNPDPRPLWHATMGRGVRGSPALGETVIAVGTADRNLVLVDRSSGEVLWRAPLAGGRRRRPPPDEEPPHFAPQPQPPRPAYAGRFRAGPPLGRAPAGSVTAPLAFDGEGLYAGTEAGMVLRLEPEHGTVLWRRPLSGAVRAGPVVTATGLVVATTNDTLYSIDRETGSVRAQLPLPGAVLATPATDGRHVYLATTNGRIVAVDLASWSVTWDRPAGDAVYGAPALSADTLFVLARDGRLWMIPVDAPDAATSHTLDIVATAGPTPLASGVLVGSVSGEVLLVDPRSGAIRWRGQVAGPIEEPPLGRGPQGVMGR